MSSRHAHWAVLILGSWGLVGCGVANPSIKEIWDADFPGVPASKTERAMPGLSGTALIEFEIKKQVYCELRKAVQASVYPVTERESLGGKPSAAYSLIPLDWIANISLSLQVDESVALNPGLALNGVLPNAVTVFGVQNSVTTPQSFSLGFGATVSSTATRIDKFNPQYSIAFLSNRETSQGVCEPGNDPFKRLGWTPPSSSPFLIESDLGIKDWLLGATVVNANLPSDVTSGAADKSGPKLLTLAAHDLDRHGGEH